VHRAWEEVVMEDVENELFNDDVVVVVFVVKKNVKRLYLKF
jgi:hypothetical protein